MVFGNFIKHFNCDLAPLMMALVNTARRFISKKIWVSYTLLEKKSFQKTANCGSYPLVPTFVTRNSSKGLLRRGMK